MFISLAAGPHPRRELTPIPSLGFTCSRSVMAARRSYLPHPPYLPYLPYLPWKS